LKPVFRLGPTQPFNEARLAENYEEVSKYR